MFRLWIATSVIGTVAMNRILSWVLSLAVLSVCSVLAAPAGSDEGRDSVAVPAGYVMVIPPSSLHSQDKADVDRPDYAGKSFRVDNNHYFFQAFPNSKVPTSSVVCIVIPFFVVFSMSAIYLLMRLIWSPLFKSRNGTLSDREKAFSNLRIVGLLNQASEDTEKGIASPEHEPSSGSATDPDSKDSDLGHLDRGIPASDSTKSKGKDMNEIAGPIVPVLRNDLDGEYSEEASDAEEEELEDELGTFNRSSQVPSDDAPAYDAAPPVAYANTLPNASMTADSAMTSNNNSKADPAHVGNNSLPSHSDVTNAQPNASTLVDTAEHPEQKSLFP